MLDAQLESLAAGGTHPSPGAKLLAEFLACTLAGFLLFCVQANALLPSTKGSGTVGFPWIAFSAGLATFFPVLMFGPVSSELNPAMMCAKWVLGRADAQEALALSAVQVAGWAVGAMLMVVMYFQHFATVPGPPRAEGGATTSVPRSVGAVAQQIASVGSPSATGMGQAMVTPWGYLRQRHAYADEGERKVEALMERCESMAVDTVEHALQPADIGAIAAELHIPPETMDTAAEPLLGRVSRAHSQAEWSLLQAEGGGTEAGDADGTVDYKAIAARLEAEYNQAVHADQLVKLNVFVTTPAIPCFVFNALQVRQRFTP